MNSCKFCGKEYPCNRDLRYHEERCDSNPEYDGPTCICRFCERQFVNRGICVAHEKVCSKNSNAVKYDYSKRYENTSDEAKNRMRWSKGETKETNSSLRHISDKLIGRKGTFSGKHHTSEVKNQIGRSVSQTLTARYAEGLISPAEGVGRGKYSYFVYKNHKFMLRSTYEFIFALYLATKDIEFNMESVRVPAITENRYSKTFIADFVVGTNIIEIKGIPSEKDTLLKLSFEACGYTFYELFYQDIEKIRQELIALGYNMDEMLENIKKGHDAREYTTHVFESLIPHHTKDS